MRFALFIAAVLPVMATAVSLGARDVETMSLELPELDTDELDVDFVNNAAEQENENADLFNTNAVCPTGFPKYCPRWGFCCSKKAVGCCRKACCRKGTDFCGRDGNCYKYT
jgi:hypothetical protein